jgi:Lipid-binding putative hydrolase
MKKILSILTLASIVLVSCEKEMPEVGGTGAEKVANEWWVRLTQDGTDVNHGYFKIATYNTASSQDSIWVDDLEHTDYGFKSKAKVDYNNLTFAAANSQNAYYDAENPDDYPLTVNISNGKVLSGAAKSKTGNTTDSIYLEVEFANDPGVKYVLSGHARTAFAEDEY